MCGIAGSLNFDRARRADSEAVGRAADAVRHRGPDDSGVWTSGPVALAHRRLAIIDIENGVQPMRDHGGNTIVFNGEIYNYIELRERLKNCGRQFYSNSDTEVILAAYREWGEDCVQHLNGMWSFALWDSRRQKLFISRDRLGEKPLYFGEHKGTLFFGSEIKCLLAGGMPKESDLSMLEIYLSLGYVPSPHTFFKNIQSLQPGHSISATSEGSRVYKYWDLPQQDESQLITDSKQVDEEFERLFTDSVRIRMRADVPFGAFLSGGLDSSSVVALMAKHSDRPVSTFTIGFDDPDFDERPLARAVSEKFLTRHHEATVEPESFDEALGTVLHHYDDPFGDSSAIPTGHVSKHASKEVTMVLTGDGGDEVLSGYTIYQGEKFAAKYGMLPKLAQKAIPSALGAGSMFLRGKPRYKANRAKRVAQDSALDFESRLISKISWADKASVKKMVASTPFDVVTIEDYISDLMSDCSFKDPFYRMMYFNTKCSLPNDMLVKVDRMSMAHSLETRLPFLDHRIVEFMAGVHKNVKMKGYERKSVLRRTVGRQLPPELLAAKKKGFGVPLREWFKGSEFGVKLRELGDVGGCLDPKAVSRVVRENVSGKADRGNFLWMLFVAQRWLKSA